VNFDVVELTTPMDGVLLEMVSIQPENRCVYSRRLQV